MKKIIEYRIIDAVEATELQLAVNAAMKKEWHPFGGVSVAVYQPEIGGFTKYSQAMVKYDD